MSCKTNKKQVIKSVKFGFYLTDTKRNNTSKAKSQTPVKQKRNVFTFMFDDLQEKSNVHFFSGMIIIKVDYLEKYMVNKYWNEEKYAYST